MPVPTAIDLYAGAGGATQGLKNAGVRVLAAIEIDHDACATYRLNHPEVSLLEADIRTIEPTDLVSANKLHEGELTILKACPPCQGFSSLRRRTPDSTNDERNDLVHAVSRFVRTIKPRAVLIENVPGLQRDRRLEDLVEDLAAAGYHSRINLLNAVDLGVPQRRRRLVLLALPIGFELPEDLRSLIPAHRRRAPMTAGQALTELQHTALPDDALDRWRKSSDRVIQRIAAVPIGGTRFDLPDELELDCHRRTAGTGQAPRHVATASYGRVRLDSPAPTMTTRCTTPACGSFIHPTLPRGLSLREAATFQTFPPGYQFYGGHDSIERQIGNAVPVWMAEALGHATIAALDSIEGS